MSYQPDPQSRYDKFIITIRDEKAVNKTKPQKTLMTLSQIYKTLLAWAFILHLSHRWNIKFGISLHLSTDEKQKFRLFFAVKEIVAAKPKYASFVCQGLENTAIEKWFITFRL